MEKLMITSAITGSRNTRMQTPYIPILPEEIARSGIEAWEAGASVLHIHARDPKTGLGTQDRSIFEEIVSRIRAKTDAVICLTTRGFSPRITQNSLTVSSGSQRSSEGKWRLLRRQEKF